MGQDREAGLRQQIGALEEKVAALTSEQEDLLVMLADQVGEESRVRLTSRRRSKSHKQSVERGGRG